MSDFGQHPNVPPPPTGGPFSPPPPPVVHTPPPGYGPPGYAPVGPGGYPLVAADSTATRPRPQVAVGSLLLIVGGVLLIIGAFLPWATFELSIIDVEETINGFSSGSGSTRDGPIFLFFGLLALGFGIAQLAARRILAVAILSVVFGVFALAAALGEIGSLKEDLDSLEEFGTASLGPGPWVMLIGAAVALAGGITTLAKRRR